VFQGSRSPRDFVTDSAIMKRLIVGILTLGLAVSPLACSRDEAPPPPREVRGEEIEAAFLDAENRLLRSPSKRIDFEVTAEGAVSAHLRGTLFLERRDRAWLEALGTLARDSVHVRLIAGSARMVGGSPENTFDVEAPPRIREAFVVGLTRMGILHNLVRLVGGQPPDHPDRSIRRWLRVSNFVSTGQTGQTTTPLLPVTFDLTVDGVPSATATVWINQSGLPQRREQRVQFENGEMHLREEYTITALNVADEPDRFRVVAPEELFQAR
jgi:hypothetical protein